MCDAPAAGRGADVHAEQAQEIVGVGVAAGGGDFVNLQIRIAEQALRAFDAQALIGPKQIAETRSSLEAFDVELSDGERTWLDRGTE